MKRARFWLFLSTAMMLTTFQAMALARWQGNGEDEFWSNTNNWNEGIIGGIDDPDVRLRSGNPGDIINVDVTGFTNAGMNFYANCTGYTITNYSLVFNNNTPEESGNLLINQSANAQTFKNDLVFQSDGYYDFIDAGSGGFVFDGAVSFTGDNEILLLGTNITFNNSVYVEDVMQISFADVIFSGTADSDINKLTFVDDGARLTVETADNVSFYAGNKFQHNASDVVVTLNSANVIGDDTTLNINGKPATYVFNADEDLGNIRLGGGQLHISLGENVSSLSFDDSSDQDWTNSTVVITNFRSGVIRFGTDAAGLTSEQLSQITSDVSETLILDDSGYLHSLRDIPPEVNIDSANGNNLVISWQGAAGATYAIQMREDLASGSWSNIIENINGIDGLISVTNNPGVSQAFFRTVTQ